MFIVRDIIPFFFVHCVQIVFGHSLRPLRLHQMQAFSFFFFRQILFAAPFHPPHPYFVSPSLCERDSIYPLGVVLLRRGTQKHVRRGALAPKGICAICIVLKGLHSTAHQSRLFRIFRKNPPNPPHQRRTMIKSRRISYATTCRTICGRTTAGSR